MEYSRWAASLWCLAGMIIWLGACNVAPGETLPPATPRPTPTANVVVGITEPVDNPLITPVDTADADAPLFELRTGQHISGDGSYLAGETEAAGPMLCRIERDSCAFQRLVVYPESGILFSRSETPPFDEEDAMMHPDMVLPLRRLSQLVEAEWGGEASIMVTETYDSLLDHDPISPDPNRKYSLHFEGRSIDFIPWPPNLARMGRLCALAYHAGFDWVHNEGDHCHASVRADSLCNVCDHVAAP